MPDNGQWPKLIQSISIRFVSIVTLFLSRNKTANSIVQLNQRPTAQKENWIGPVSVGCAIKVAFQFYLILSIERVCGRCSRYRLQMNNNALDVECSYRSIFDRFNFSRSISVPEMIWNLKRNETKEKIRLPRPSFGTWNESRTGFRHGNWMLIMKSTL